MKVDWHGIYPALSTPVDDDGVLDEKSLRAEVRWAIEKGAHGVIVSLMSGEFHKFTDAERMRCYEIVVDEAGGEVPVLAGTSHSGTEGVIALSNHAREVGADGIVVLPPWFDVQEASNCLYEHYATVANRVDIPMMIQDCEGVGPYMCTTLFRRLLDDFDNIVSVKLEGPRSWNKLLEMKSFTDDVPIFGGMAARNMYNELEAGAHGNVPDTCLTDVLVDVYDSYVIGEVDKAKESFAKYRRWLDYLTLHMASWAQVEKETLRQRGVIKSSYTRLPRGPELSDDDKRVLDHLLREMELVMRV
jgi:dihydrodipicolinate synthase/N-acetylneuraminate lyase